MYNMRHLKRVSLRVSLSYADGSQRSLPDIMAHSDDTVPRLADYPSQAGYQYFQHLTIRLFPSEICPGEDRQKLRKHLSKAANAVIFLTTISPTGFFSRKHLTDQIRRLCRHNETSIFERHSTHLSVDRMTESDKRALGTLCKKQLEFSRSHMYV